MRFTGIRFLDLALVLVLLSGFGYFAFNWAIGSIIHNRKEQIVPDLRNKSVDAVLDILGPLNLAVRKEGSEVHEAIPIGSIVRQMPPPGTTVRSGKVIRVVVSQGGETVFVPSLTGLPLRNAEMLLRQRLLLLGEVSESYSIRMDKGRVMSQDPEGDSSEEKNALVNVVVSAGRPPREIVLMPDFRQQQISKALSWADELELAVWVTTETASLFPNGAVLTQEPPPDSVVSARSRIKFMVSGRPASFSRDTAMKADGDPRTEAQRLIDYLGRRGHTGFGELLNSTSAVGGEERP